MSTDKLRDALRRAAEDICVITPDADNPVTNDNLPITVQKSVHQRGAVIATRVKKRTGGGLSPNPITLNEGNFNV